MSSSLGMATISFDFSATATCPSTRRWRAAKADTMCSEAAPLSCRRSGATSCRHSDHVLGHDLGRGSGERGGSGYKATLERRSIERGQDTAEMIVGRGAVRERSETAQKGELLFAEAGHVGDRLGPGQHGEKVQQQDLVEPVDDLAALARVGQTPDPPPSSSTAASSPESEDHDRFSTSPHFHELLHPIALAPPELRSCILRPGT